MRAKSEEILSRPYPSYTNAEIDRWVALRNNGSSSGGKLTWRQVSERTGIKAIVMATIFYQRNAGRRKNYAEQNAERAELVEKLLLKGLKLHEMSRKLGLSPQNLNLFLHRIGIPPEERARCRRVAGFRRETLELTREKRGVVE